MEAEAARHSPQATLKPSPLPPELNLYDRIRARVEPFGGLEPEPPPRQRVRVPPTFE